MHSMKKYKIILYYKRAILSTTLIGEFFNLLNQKTFIISLKLKSIKKFFIECIIR